MQRTVLTKNSHTGCACDEMLTGLRNDDGKISARLGFYLIYCDLKWALADFDALGNVTLRYLFGDAVDEIVARWTPGDATAWYLTGHLCTIRDLVID
jgi:hypothetical protein